MPHDKFGIELKPGDMVMIQATVLSVQPGEEFCNVSLETVEPMYPGTHKTAITANAKQVVKVSQFKMADDSAADRERAAMNEASFAAIDDKR